MKKALFATTALGMLAASSAFAAGPTVTLGGYADFQVGHTDQEGDYSTTTNDLSGIYDRDLRTQTDTEVHIAVDGRTDNGLGYGAYIELEADVNQDDATSANNNAERTFIYIESGLGRVEAGANGDAADALRVDAATFARASGGIGGDFYDYVDLDGNSGGTAVDDYFYTLPGLPTAVMPSEVEAFTNTDRATANKITYYSPRISGLQFGASYTPDQGDRGTSNGFSGDTGTAANNVVPGDFENVFNLGLNYSGQFDGVGIDAAVTADLGEAEDDTAAAKDDLKAYNLGLNLSFAGFTVGGSYAMIDEIGATSTRGAEGDYWTAGAAYEAGPFAASVTYLQSEMDAYGDITGAGTDTEFSNIAVGADYQLAPGLVPYIEVNFFETDDNDSASVDNEGTVFIFGTELSF